MISIDSKNASPTLHWQNYDNPPAVRDPAPDSAVPPSAGTEAVKVTLSSEALNRAGKVASANQDIEDSGLPETIQQLLKMIRQLKKQLAEKSAELQAVMTDRSLSEAQRQARLGALQSEIGALSGGLSSASANLAKAMQEQGLSPGQMLQAASLMAS
jgi:Sec-independent protein translocase protein TatA